MGSAQLAWTGAKNRSIVALHGAAEANQCGQGGDGVGQAGPKPSATAPGSSAVTASEGGALMAAVAASAQVSTVPEQLDRRNVGMMTTGALLQREVSVSISSIKMQPTYCILDKT